MSKLQDLRFNITENMSNIIIEVISINEILRNDELSKEEKIILEERKKKLTNTFIKEFRKNNVEQRKVYNEIMKDKKNREE